MHLTSSVPRLGRMQTKKDTPLLFQATVVAGPSTAGAGGGQPTAQPDPSKIIVERSEPVFVPAPGE